MAENSSGCESLLRRVPVTPSPGGGEFLRRRVPSSASPGGGESEPTVTAHSQKPKE